MFETILGIVRKENSPELWETFADEETALHAELSDVIFGDSVDDCKIKLEQQFPASDARLTRVHQFNEGTYDGRGRYRQAPTLRVSNLSDQHYDGQDQLTALALARQYGSIKCRLRRTRHGRNDVVDWKAEGCVIQAMSGWNCDIKEIRYNPKGVARAIKAAATRAKRQAVKCSDVAHATSSLRDLVRTHIRSLSYEAPNGKYSIHNVAWYFLETAKYFSFVYGPQSYRKHPAFRELKDLWKKRAESSRKMFLRSAERTNLVIPTFCNLMDHEIRIRNAKLITDDKDWKPRHEFPSFDEFCPAVYDKVIKAREKAERADTKARTVATAKRRSR